MPPSQKLLELAEHFAFIYAESKGLEIRGLEVTETYSVTVSATLLAEWSKYIDNPRLDTLIKPGVVYTSKNAEQKDAWLSLNYNAGMLLGTCMANKVKLNALQHLELENVEGRHHASTAQDLF